jgi:Na+-driven multidrug efflux pump
MRNIFGFFGVFTWAFAATTNTMVSNIIGQGKNEQVIFLIRKIVRISMCIAVLVALVLNLFPALFLKMYGQGDTFVEDAIPVVRIVALALLVMSFSTVWLNAVTGTGNSKITLYIEIVAIVLYSIYVYVVLEVLKLPITIGWMSEYLYWLALFGASFYYIRSGKWKDKVI